MSVRHIVLFKVKSDVTQQNLQKWINDILLLKQTCQGILSLSLEPHTAVYDNYVDRNQGFNYILDGMLDRLAYIYVYITYIIY